jgi:cytoskeletal protein CcmA (bactofilin family)
MAKPLLTADPASVNFIGEGSEVEGVLRSFSDVRVNGRISGELRVEGKVIIAEKGIVDGTLIATSADIAGKVSGEIHITERLMLKPTAHIEGVVRTGRLVVEEGATFDGQCDMGRLEDVRKARLGTGKVLTSNAEFIFEAVEKIPA